MSHLEPCQVVGTVFFFRGVDEKRRKLVGDDVSDLQAQQPLLVRWPVRLELLLELAAEDGPRLLEGCGRVAPLGR